MRAAIIVNPASGLSSARTHRRESRTDRVRRWIDEAGIAAEVRTTTCRGHAAELCAEFAAGNRERVVVWGGDGTINEAAAPLIGTTTALGIIPGGSGDGLARSLGLPRDPQSAFKVAMTGSSRPIDVGWLGDRHFLNIAGVGFDAEVARRFNQRKGRGTRGYIVESLRMVWSYRCKRYTIAAGDVNADGPHFLAAFANGREYGSGLQISPQSDPADGLLDLLLVAGGGPFRQLWRARRLFLNPLKPAEGILRSPITEARVSGERMCCHVDGETFEVSGELEVRMKAGALRVIAA
jgi:diacylglycerol kinase (ATP)